MPDRCCVCGAERSGERTCVMLDFDLAVVVRWCEACRLDGRDAFVTIAADGGRHSVNAPKSKETTWNDRK